MIALRHERMKAEIVELYVRACRDARFKMDPVSVARLTAATLGISPLEIWMAIGWDCMVRCADGSHQAVQVSQQDPSK